ncbi:MAG: putative ABC transporter permease [Finegoldia magna]|nr:putative ABC transporter permease [Finegoldia magna]
MELINFIYLFFFYAVFGYIWEVIWVSSCQKKLTNRGFLYGPLLPIYGFGAVFITLFVDHAIARFNDSYIVIFFSGLIIATALEFLSGYLIEKIFKVRYWDYTERFMNVKGLICLRSSLFFGVMSIFMMDYSNKYILELTEKIKNSNYNFVIYILIAIFSVDVVISVKQAYGFRYIIQYQEKMESYLKEIKKDVKLKAL